MAVGNAINFTRDLATVTIGGNDAQFIYIFLFCMAHFSCNEIKPFLPYSAITLGDFAPLLIASVRTQVVEIHKRLRDAMPNAATIVLDYPILVSGNECPAAQFPPFGNSSLKLSASEQVFLRKVNEDLNTAIEMSTKVVGLHYISVADRFVGHEICSSAPWINGVVVFNPTFNPKASAHPTARGQEEYANAVNDYLARNSVGWPYGYHASGMPRNPPPSVSLQRAATLSVTPSALPAFGDLLVSLQMPPRGCERMQAVILPGSSARLRGGGFLPNEQVSLSIATEGHRVELGSATVGADGRLDVAVNIPFRVRVGSVVSVEALGGGLNGAGRLLLTLAHVASSVTIDTNGDCLAEAKTGKSHPHGSHRGEYDHECDAELSPDGIAEAKELGRGGTRRVESCSHPVVRPCVPSAYQAGDDRRSDRGADRHHAGSRHELSTCR